jgi:hypothetical protein
MSHSSGQIQARSFRKRPEIPVGRRQQSAFSSAAVREKQCDLPHLLA